MGSRINKQQTAAALREWFYSLGTTANAIHGMPRPVPPPPAKLVLVKKP